METSQLSLRKSIMGSFIMILVWLIYGFLSFMTGVLGTEGDVGKVMFYTLDFVQDYGAYISIFLAVVTFIIILITIIPAISNKNTDRSGISLLYLFSALNIAILFFLAPVVPEKTKNTMPADCFIVTNSGPCSPNSYRAYNFKTPFAFISSKIIGQNY